MPFTPVPIFLTLALCANSAMGADGARRVWQIEGVEREAIVHLPTGAPHPCPVILAFHGHGGRAQSVQRSMHFQDEWPEAVVFYPQGLAT